MIMRNTHRVCKAFLVIGSLALGAGISHAQDKSTGKDTPASGNVRTITIMVPDSGTTPTEYFVRQLPSPDAKTPSVLPVGPFKDKKFTVSVDPANLGKSGKIAVDNAHTGNTAVLEMPKTDIVDLHAADFDHVHRVEVKVTFENKPVQIAQVTIVPDGKGGQLSKTIDPAALGMSVFDDVQVGKAKVVVTYGDKLTQSVDVPITTDHPGDKITVPIAVSTKVATVENGSAVAPPSQTTPGGVGTSGAPTPNSPAVAAPAGTQPSATQVPSQGSGIIGFIGDLVGLGIVVAFIYFLAKWGQSGGLAATLKKMGIETNGPPAPSAAGTPWQPNASSPPVVSDPTICQFCGQKKDGNGNCACTLSGAALATGPASPAIPTQPKLVGTGGVYSGSIFPLTLNGSPATLGRDATNTIPLGNDTTVSRRHAAVHAENGGFIVSDEGSSNGIYLNGVKVAGSQPLRPGDELQVGNTRFRFEL